MPVLRQGPALLALSLLFVVNSSYSQAGRETPQSWFDGGQAELQAALSQTPNSNRAKNIVLMIGDGMGVSTVTAGRIFEGQENSQPGEENLLAFERLPYLALAKTYNTNQQTPDSAGTMTAMVTGVKSKAGFIAVNQIPERGNCEQALQHSLPTFLEQAEEAGLATGIVTTARITHATPAATYAHTPERNWEADSNMPNRAKAQGCRDIARQLIEFNHGDGVEVAFGGGRRYFLPTEKNGVRADSRDLTREWQQRFGDENYVTDKSTLDALDPNNNNHVLGLFSNSHLRYYHDRLIDPDNQEPDLMAMTAKAIDILERNPKGYFLMVEAGRIDHAHHAGNAYRALKDTQEFSQTVALVVDRVDLSDTLVIVTADHSHTLTIAGYPTRGNAILGKVVGNDNRGNQSGQDSKASDQHAYTTLGYRNGPGAENRTTLREVDTLEPDYMQQALVPMESETHAGEDVAIYAGGPWAHLFQRTHEQHYIYHVMQHAAQLLKPR